MLKLIVYKEIVEHIKSLRMMIAFILLIILMSASSFMFVSKYTRAKGDYDRNKSETIQELSRIADRSSALFNIFSFNWNGPWVYRQPPVLGFISDGYSGVLPNSFSPSAFKLYGPVKKIRSNFLMWKSIPVDLVFIVGTILSFIAIILVYDGISGERERGTLRLISANSITKALLLLGKYIGSVTVLASALLLGFLISLLIMLFGQIPLGVQELLYTSAAFFISLIYVSLFILIGLLISSFTQTSAESLVISLLVWIILVIIIPGTGGMLAAKLTNIPDGARVANEAENARSEVVSSYNESEPGMGNVGFSGHWSPGEPLERAILGDDAWSEVRDDYRNKMLEQVNKARLLTLISPTQVYSLSMETIACSGIVQYEHFYESLQEYKLTLRRLLLDLYPHSGKWLAFHESIPREEMYRLIGELAQIKVDINSFPHFEETRLSSRETVSSILPYITILILFNILVFSWAFVKFIKYDVR